MLISKMTKKSMKKRTTKSKKEREANFNDVMDGKRPNTKTNQNFFLLLRLLISTLIAFDLVIQEYDLY